MLVIPRKTHGRAVARLLRESPAVLLLGARQVGKTTLAKEIAKSWSRGAHRFDLEDDRDLARLADPFLALEPLRGLVVLDEVQRRPNLFPALRVLADRRRTPSRFLLLGSASPALLQQSSETLAGRVAHYELSGFDLSEVGPADADRLWVRGGFPRSFAARSGTSSFRWRDDFVHTFLARDLAALGISIPGATMERFWTMLAHYHGQVWNGSELARAFGVSHHVVRRYLEALESVFMVRSLKPWSANLKKRQVRTPKVYVRDSGLLHRLLDIRTTRELERHPKVGASWEGFVIECVLRALNVRAWFQLLLADAHGRRAGPAGSAGRAAARLRDQADDRTPAHPLDALRHERPGPVAPGRHPRRLRHVPARGRGTGRVARAAAGRPLIGTEAVSDP